MLSSDEENGAHSLPVAHIKQEPVDHVDWIIEENIHSDEDNDNSSDVNKPDLFIKKELDETEVTKSPNRHKLKLKCTLKQKEKSSKVSCFNSLIANLKEKALLKQCNEAIVDYSGTQNNNKIDSLEDGNRIIKEEPNISCQNSHYVPTGLSPQICPTSNSLHSVGEKVASSYLTTSKDTESPHNIKKISDLTLRNMLMHMPSVVTNSTIFTSSSDSVGCQANDSKTQPPYSDKAWLPRLTELIKSTAKTTTCNNSEDIKVCIPVTSNPTSGISTKYDQLLKDLVFGPTKQMPKDHENQKSCQKMLPPKTLSSLLSGKMDDPKPFNTSPVFDDRYDCQECDKSFATFSSLIAHKKYHRLKQKLVCTMCKKEFSVKRDYERHLKEHDEPVEYTCTVCDKIFSVIGALKRHMLIHREQPTKEDKFFADDLYGEGIEECPVCGDKFSKYYIKYHMKIHSSDRPYTCTKCDKSFTHKQSLVAHKLKHKRETMVWNCDICDRTFDYEYLLKRHMKIHTKYKCDKCDKTLRNKASYLSHWRTHNTSSYLCDVCHRTYSRYSAYFSHYQSHNSVDNVPLPENMGDMVPESSGQPDIEKDDCLTNNINKSDLFDNDEGLSTKYSGGNDSVIRDNADKCDNVGNSLLNVYFAEKKSVAFPTSDTGGHAQTPHSCPVCKWDATNPSALKRHMRVHEPKAIKGKKAFVDSLYKEGVVECSVCGEKFSRYYIKYHMKIHSSDRPYACDKCDKSFTHKSSLAAHDLIHQRKNCVWYCDFCKRAFEYEYLFKRHMKIHPSYPNITSQKTTFIPEPSIEINNIEEDVTIADKEPINKLISNILSGLSKQGGDSETSTDTCRMEIGDQVLPGDNNSYMYVTDADQFIIKGSDNDNSTCSSQNIADADKSDDEQRDSVTNAEANETISDLIQDRDGDENVMAKYDDKVPTFIPGASDDNSYSIQNNNDRLNCEVLISEEQNSENSDVEFDSDLPVQFATD